MIRIITQYLGHEITIEAENTRTAMSELADAKRQIRNDAQAEQKEEVFHD